MNVLKHTIKKFIYGTLPYYFMKGYKPSSPYLKYYEYIKEHGYSRHLYEFKDEYTNMPVDVQKDLRINNVRPCRGRFPKRISQSAISPSRWMSYVSELKLRMEELSIFSLLLWKMGIRYLSKLIRYRILHRCCSITA